MEAIGKRIALFRSADTTIPTSDHLLLLCKMIDSVTEDEQAAKNTDAA